MLQYTLATGLTAGAVLFTSVAAAADDTLAPVVVTASRSAETTDQTLAPVSVITRAEIERRQPRDLLELLRTQPGIDLARNGGPGQQTSLFLRGTNSDHTLVLIDGVRASSITTGGFAWQHLTPSQIERIEIVRGPRASLYGSDAIGGVIQIFTRRSEGPTLSIGAGSDRTFQGEAGYGGSHGIHTFSLHAAAENSDGFSATNPDIGFGHDPDDDGYRNRSLSGRWQADFSKALSLSAAFWHSEGDIQFDEGSMDSINQNLSLTLDGQVNDRWSQSLQLGFARDDLDTDSAFASQVDGNRLTADWQHDFLIGMSHLLSVGLDYYRDQGENIDEVTSTTVFDEIITNRAAFASLQTGLGANDLQFSLRHDEHSRAGGETTGSAAWGRALGHGLRAVASWGTAFKAPTLNQLFHPGFGGFFAGNPDLEPERSHSAELGLRYHSSERSARRASVNLFHTRIDDLIAFQGTNSQAINIDEATIRGLELEYADAFGPWSVDASLTLQRARDDDTDDPLLRRPDEKLSLTLGRDFQNRSRITAELLLVGEREDVGTRLPGYGLVNLAGQHQLTRTLKLQARIENLLDKDYELASGFNTPDRKLMATLEYAPR